MIYHKGGGDSGESVNLFFKTRPSSDSTLGLLPIGASGHPATSLSTKLSAILLLELSALGNMLREPGRQVFREQDHG